MSSQNDIVWLALHAGELTQAQINELDLSMLRSFEPRGMGYSVEMFKVSDCEASAPPAELTGAADFVAALNRAAQELKRE